jgi:hypothetical protein
MIRDYRAVRAVASAISDAADETMEAYRKERVVDEPHITDRLMGAIETTVNHLKIGSVLLPFGGGMRMPLRWEAMTLRAGSRSAAHEKKFGADILGVLKIDIRDYRTSKGFLAQAKRAEPRQEFDRSEWRRLQEQCEKMLAITPDSFVIIYSIARGVRFFSAQAVHSFSGRNIFDLYDLGIRSFFEKHLQSFIGDRRIDQPKVDTLEKLYPDGPSDINPSRHVLSIRASEAE